MACPHPRVFYEEIRDKDGELIGLRCAACKAETYKGDTWWTTFKRAYGLKRGPN